MIANLTLSRRRFVAAGLIHAAAVGSGATSIFALTPLPPESSDKLAWLSITEAAHRIRSGALTSTQLVLSMLERIEIYQPKLKAFITVMRESALRHAADLDREAATGRFRGPLHGIPIAVKDNIDTADARTTMASAVFDDRVPQHDAFVVEQLRRAGAVVLGKTNLHEFAMGGSSATSYFGPVRNPWALDRVPSGSSGGSAAAVAAGLAMGALGTDTGGSVRMPAAYCGIVGLKPTYGLVSIGGIFPLIYSMDHCGPLTRSVEDAALMLNAMTGYDKHDVASVEHVREDYVAAMSQPVNALRLGIPRAPFFDRVDPETSAAVEQAIAVLSKLVKSTRDVSLPSFNAVPWTLVRSSEVEAEHRKSFEQSGGLYSLQTHRVVEGTQKELNDTQTESSANRVADAVDAHWELERTRRVIDDAFNVTDSSNGFDLVVMPTMRIQPRTVQAELDREEDPKPTEPEIESNAIAWNIWGLPAISIPCGFAKDGIPIGVQIAGPCFSEGKILALAKVYQDATQWHLKHPKLSPDMPVPAVKRKT